MGAISSVALHASQRSSSFQPDHRRASAQAMLLAAAERHRAGDYAGARDLYVAVTRATQPSNAPSFTAASTWA